MPVSIAETKCLLPGADSVIPRSPLRLPAMTAIEKSIHSAPVALAARVFLISAIPFLEPSGVESADAAQGPGVRTPDPDLLHRLLTGTAEPQGGDAHRNTPSRSGLLK